MIDDVFAVIADSTRRQILQALTGGSRPVGELVDELGISQPTVSKHLKVLRNVGLVQSKAAGQKRFYSLTPEPLTVVAEWVAELQDSALQPAEAPEETASEEIAAASLETKSEAELTPLATAALSDQSKEAALVPEEATSEAEISKSQDVTQEEEPQLPVEDASSFESQNETQDNEPIEEIEEEVVLQRGVFTLGSEGAAQQAEQPHEALNAADFTPLTPFVPEGGYEPEHDPTTSIDVSTIPFVPAEDAETNLDVVVVEEDYGFTESSDSNVMFVADIDGFAPFTPDIEVAESNEEEAEGTEIIEAESIFATEDDTVIDEAGLSETVVDDAVLEEEMLSDVPNGYIAYTGEPDSTEFVDDVPETELTESPEASNSMDEAETVTDESVVQGEIELENPQSQTAFDTNEEASSVAASEDDENQESRGFLASLTRWGRRRSR